jgi:hypothetical protein
MLLLSVEDEEERLVEGYIWEEEKEKPIEDTEEVLCRLLLLLIFKR